MTGKQKILLIEPPYYRLFKDTYSNDRYPLWQGYLAGAVKKETDWDVAAFNADFTPNSEAMFVSYVSGVGFDRYKAHLNDEGSPIWGQLRRIISARAPTVVGISAKSQNFASVRMVAKLAREFDRGITVIVGGPYPSMTNADALRCDDIDILVRGEGEATLVDLLGALEKGGPLDDVPGIIFRKNGGTVETARREYIRDLDSLTHPHVTAPEVLMDHAKYPPAAFQKIFATRGCPYNCSFCGSRYVWSRAVRFRSPMNIVEEIESLRRIGVQSVHFEDDTWGVNSKYIGETCEALLRHCPGIKWSCELHVKLVKEEIIQPMKRAGCHAISIGIESGNDEMLKKIRKGFTSADAYDAVNMVKKHGIEAHTFFMIGFPFETEETLRDTVRMMRNINCDGIVFSVFTPYPGTELFEYCREKKLVDDSFDVSLYNHQSPENCFSEHIPKERFKTLRAEVEKMVDRKSFKNRVRKMFSVNVLWRMRELGLRRSISKALSLFNVR